MRFFRFAAITLVLLVSTAGLVSCKTETTRQLDAQHSDNQIMSHYPPNHTEVRLRSFKRCEAAIDRAYRKLTRFKMSRPHGVTYDNWTELNQLLADSLSAMQNKRYFSCRVKVQKLISYMQDNFLYPRRYHH